MGRRQRVSLEYFYTSVNMEQVEKLLRAKFGLEGIGVLLQFKRIIFGDKGYYMEYSEDHADMFAAENFIDRQKLDLIVEFLISRDIFSREIYEKKGILTSKEIQDQYIAASLKRTSVRIESELLLTEPYIPDWSKLQVKIDSKDPPDKKEKTAKPKTRKKPAKPPGKSLSVSKKKSYPKEYYRAALDIYEEHEKIPNYPREMVALKNIMGWLEVLGYLTAEAMRSLAMAHLMIREKDSFWKGKAYLPSTISYNMFNSLIQFMKNSKSEIRAESEKNKRMAELLDGVK